MASVRVKVEFGRIEQVAQQVGTEDEYMLAAVHTRVTHAGKTFEGVTRIKQITGSRFCEENNVEVERPDGYKGPLDFMAFSEGATRHYKQSVFGRAIQVGPGQRLNLIGNVFEMQATVVSMDCDDSPRAAW